jgi:N-methylhydantoinase B
VALAPDGLPVDAARFEVVKNALASAAEEMKIVLAKTAYSPLLKASGDYSCGIFDASGNMVAQGPDLPIHLGSMPDVVRRVVTAFPDVVPDDVFIQNDPYQGGSHLPDVNVMVPAFADGRLLGYGCVRAHWADIGSATPGSYGAVTEVYGEGLRLPPIRLFRNGELDPNIAAIIFANVRQPAERLGDLRAQVAANRRAVARLTTLAEKYGTDELLRIMTAILDYSETMMRAALRALPDGDATFEEVFDGDGVLDVGETEDATFTVRGSIHKRGDSITVDFTGSDPRVAGPMNAPLTVTASGVFGAIKMIADPRNLIPPNSGCWRPIRVEAPAGSVVNAQEPAPVVYANHEISLRVSDIILGAMFQISAGTCVAGSQGTGGVVIFGGSDYRTGRGYVSYEVTKGGVGARPIKDGINAIGGPLANQMNTPIEMLEMSFPLRVEEYALIPDSGGAGRWRGGLAARRSWRILRHNSQCTTCCERTVTAPPGLNGGLAGAPARTRMQLPDGTMRRVPSKGAFVAPAGSLVILDVPGSGGFGPPQERDPALLQRDLVDGYVTAAAAQRDYGIDPADLLDETASKEAAS